MQKRPTGRVMTKARILAPWRLLAPGRVVRRRVQGVDLVMPWSHRLPDLAGRWPQYGQNLVALAENIALADQVSSPLQVLDIGANIGDSVVQLLDVVDAEVLCVEADPYWLEFLHRNVDTRPTVTVEAALLATGEVAPGEVFAVRARGTTRFVGKNDGGLGTPVERLSVRDLRSRHAAFDEVRLVKSDTDGWDDVLIPEVASTWSDKPPVLFFEFDPRLIGLADGHRDANAVWDELAGAGYDQVAVWDNYGNPLGRLDVSEVAAASRACFAGRGRGYDYWDVALSHSSDLGGRRALEMTMPAEFAESLTTA